MSTINLSTFGPTITKKNVGAITGEIQKVMQGSESFVMDFSGIKGIEMAAARELMTPIRKRYGSGYREKVQLINVTPVVNNAIVFSGSTGGKPVASAPVTGTRRFTSAFSHIFATLTLLFSLAIGQTWASVWIDSGSQPTITINGTSKGASSLTNDNWGTQTDLCITYVHWYGKRNDKNSDGMWGKGNTLMAKCVTRWMSYSGSWCWNNIYSPRLRKFFFSAGEIRIV